MDSIPRLVGKAEHHEPVLLSFAQQRLWFLAQMEGVSEAYHIPFGVRLKGTLDRVALRRALDRIVARHEALRTTFSFSDDHPVQQIVAADQSHFELLEDDLRQHSDVEVELSRLIQKEARDSFSLEAGPLLRGRVIRLDEEEHALLITTHHIVSDGWSIGIFLNELSALYAAFRQGKADPLPKLEVQYTDYALWQRQWMQGDVLQQQAAYWKAALAGAPEKLEVPVDHPRPEQQDYRGGFAEVVLDAELTSGLKALSKRHGTTLYMTLLAAWAVLLARLSGQQDIVIGTPTANRQRSEVQNLIGFFVNTLALRLNLADSPTVSQLLQQAKAVALAGQQHQDIPFEQVVEIVQPVRSLSHSPLFQVMFAWQNVPEGHLELPGLELKPLRAATYRVSNFDLTLVLQQAGNMIAGGIGYAASLFEPATIERYIGYFRNLIEGMIADDSKRVCLGSA